MNHKGQLSIIAALLVAVILITAVAATYSLIRDNPVQGQPQIQSALDETDLAIKQILWSAVSYYGSILRVTGNSTYAKTNATNYLQSGLAQIANTHPEWASTVSMNNVNLYAYWYTSTSYSGGDLTVTYNLTGLGITGMSYTTSCKLSVGITNPISNQACLNVTEDAGQPLLNLGKQNFLFFLYQNSSWQLTAPSTDPTTYANGTYQITPPTGIDANSYLVQVQDQRGIIVVASSYSSYSMNLTWPSTISSYYYVNGISDVDGNGDTGTHSNFAAQQNGPDNINDTLTEANVPTISGDTQQYVQSNSSQFDTNIGGTSNFTTEKYSDGIFDTLTEANATSGSPEKYSYFNNNGGVWTSPANAYDNNTGTAATYSLSGRGYSAYLTLNLTYVTRGSKIRYWVDRDNYGISTMDIYISNQTGSWLNVYSATPTYGAYANASIPFSQYTAVRFRFTYTSWNGGTAYVYEAQGVNDTVPANYQLDLERQWTSAPYNMNGSKLLCIKTGMFSDEALEVDVRSGASWTVLNSSLVANAWNNISVSLYLTNASFAIRFIDTTITGDAVQSTWQIDSVLLHTWNITDNYQLCVEEQWRNANYTGINKELDIFMGPFSSPAEALSVQWWNTSSSSWLTVIPNLAANNWNNISATTYLTSQNFTIRFSDGTPTGDSVQSSWQIDAALLRIDTKLSLSSVPDTCTMELLQNGTTRWLGQSLQLTTPGEKPFPPIPVKDIHVNQTINGLSSEVPFQIEDWASAYRVPLGLTSNVSLFNRGNMLVFLANSNVSRVTVWWNGSDMATQTLFAYKNRYFTDNPSSGVLNNSKMTLQIPTSFVLTSTVGSFSCTANFMRINAQTSTYGSNTSLVITNGVVRDIIHQEAEWSNGAKNCPNVYSDIVLTLPANATYYTYQLTLIFINSTRSRSITDLCPIWLSTTSAIQTQTENGTTGGLSTVVNGTGLFYNSSSVWQHHWSQFISGTAGAGIMFTDESNQGLYTFDSIAGSNTGALVVSATAKTIQLLPVNMSQVSFTNPMNVVWYGAVATFSGTTPIYNNSDQTGLWMLVEYPPTINVSTGN